MSDKHRTIFLTISLFYLLPRTGAVQQFDAGENSTSADVGDNVTLTWTYQGGDSGLLGVKLSTYIESKLDFIWSMDKDGVNDNSVPVPQEYNGRLRATKVANKVSLIIENVIITDSNTYVCIINNAFSGPILGPNRTLLVESVKPTISATPSSETQGGQKDSNIGVIAGGVIGGVAALAIIALAVFYFNKNKHSRASTGGGESNVRDTYRL